MFKLYRTRKLLYCLLIICFQIYHTKMPMNSSSIGTFSFIVLWRVSWNFVFRSFGVQWVLPNRVIDLLDGWWNMLGIHSSNIWNTITLCLMWTIWRERNSRTFEDKEKSERQLLDGFLVLYLTGHEFGALLLAALL
jgi:hypothetical protein